MVKTDIILCDNIEDSTEKRNTREIVFALDILRGGGAGFSLGGEGLVGGVPIPTRGHTLWCSISIMLGAHEL
jgi:hypothetical protein